MFKKREIRGRSNWYEVSYVSGKKNFHKKLVTVISDKVAPDLT